MKHYLWRRQWRTAIGLLAIGVVACSLTAYGMMRPTGNQEITANSTPAAEPAGITVGDAAPGGRECIPPGQDCWMTWCGSGTQANFSQNPIPAGFFDPGSLPFDGIIGLGNGTGWIDTVIDRLGELCFTEPLPSTAAVPIELVQLDLASCAPITVGGSGDWDVTVTLSGPQPGGTLQATKTYVNGGTFTADFFVQPVFTFTRVDPPYDTRVFTGLQVMMQMGDEAPWSDDETYEFCSLDGFAAGMSEYRAGEPCCEEVCHHAGPGYPEGHMHCTRPPECPACETPTYCDGAGGYCCDEFISRVQLGVIDNSSGQSYYADYTALSAHLLFGTDYTITVTNAEYYSTDITTVWIDWNQDKDFYDAGEQVLSGDPGGAVFTGSFQVAGGALEGATRMRVRIQYGGTPDPCGTTTYGEVEDYTVIIAPPPPCDHSVVLTDSYGDGWTTGTTPAYHYLDVYVNGVLVLNDITLATGYGPLPFTFSAATGDTIFLDFTDNGSWESECGYCVYDGTGTLLGCAVGPNDLTVTGNCAVVSGACCDRTTGVCTDDTPAADCPAPLEFTADTLCVDLFPPCEPAYCGDTICQDDEDCCNCPEDCGAYACLNQPPNQSTGIFSDVNCDFCYSSSGGWIQILADQFMVCPDGLIQLDGLRFWGGYYPGDIVTDPDLFMVIFRADNGGVPGDEILALGPMAATTKAQTGVVLFGVHEYVYTIDLDPNPSFSGGTYFIEIYNDTSDTTDSWFWEAAALDACAGVAGQAWTTTLPEPPWNYGPQDMALELECVEEVCIPPGQDCWMTWCGSGTQADFSLNPIPAGFFDDGSDLFDGIIELGNGTGWIDTVMERLGQLCFTEPLPSTDAVPIKLVQLSLVNCAPITVGGSGDWNVVAFLPMPMMLDGTLTATKTYANGGTFTADFWVQVVFRFTRVDPPYDERIFTGPQMMMLTRGEAPWSDDETYDFCTHDGFAAGMSEDPDGVPCCEEVCHDAGPGYPEGHMHCTRPPECPPCPEEPEPCEAVGARSYRYHGSAGRLGLDMGLSDGVEPRLGGIQELEIDLAPGGGAAFGGTAWVSCSAEWTSGHSGGEVPGVAAGDTVTVFISPPLPNQAWCVVELDCGAYVCVRGLSGDIDRSGLVTPGDASIIKPKFAQTATAANAQYDYDVSGLITPGDFSQVKPRFGNSAPECGCKAHQDPWGTIFNDTLPDNGTAVEFGSADIPPIPADFFYPGSDSLMGTVALVGSALDVRRLGMTDTMIQRTGPVCFPGTGYPRPSAPVQLEIVELSLVAPEPMIVTGPYPSEEWLLAMGLSNTQAPGSLAATLESPAGGTFTAAVPVTPLCVFVKVSDLADLEAGLIPPEDVNVRIMDFGAEGIPAVHMGWDEPVPFSTSPPTEGFSCDCDPCGGLCFYPGVHEAGRQVNPPHIAAGGPGHLHYINPPPPPPKFCWYREIGWNNTQCFWWHFWPGPLIRSGIQCNTVANCPRFMIRVYRCWPTGGFCVHFYARAFCR